MILLSFEFTENGLDHAGEHMIGLQLRDKLIKEFASLTDEPRFSEREKGKPYIIYSNVTYSITHTDGCAACAINVPGAVFNDLPTLPEIVTESGVYKVGLTDDLPCEIGLDVERIDRDRGEARLSAIAMRYFTEEETRLVEKSNDKHKEFYRIWTAKESLVKCTGEGLSGVGFAETERAEEMGFELFHFLIRNRENEFYGTICRNDCLLPEENKK